MQRCSRALTPPAARLNLTRVMDSPRKKTVVTVLLAAVWLAVVVGAVYIAITRRKENTAFAYIIPAAAFFMLTIFVGALLPPKLREKPLAERLSALSVGALILFALAVLGYAIVKTRIGLPTIVLAVFFVAFLRIFVDWINHVRHPEKRSRGRKPRKLDDPETDDPSH
ncbi:MAG: hypothetical protein V2A58_00160 [Planctomycetota bacterium]